MTLTKQTVIDKIEIFEDGKIQHRQATRVYDDGVLIAETYHRLPVLEPGDETQAIDDARVQVVAETLWTPEVISAFEEKKRIAEETRIESAEAVENIR